MGLLGKMIKNVTGVDLAAPDQLGSFVVPGSAEVELPAGAVKITYQESRRAKTDEDRIYFDLPDTVAVSVTPASGGDPLEIKQPQTWAGTGSSRQVGLNYSRDLVGTVEITSPGRYVVSATGEAGLGSVEPQILIGS